MDDNDIDAVENFINSILGEDAELCAAHGEALPPDVLRQAMEEQEAAIALGQPLGCRVRVGEGPAGPHPVPVRRLSAQHERRHGAQKLFAAVLRVERVGG